MGYQVNPQEAKDQRGNKNVSNMGYQSWSLKALAIKYAQILKIMTRYECLVMPDMAAPLGWLS